MDKSTHEIRLAQWASIIQECNTSGMTKKKWCQENNINEKQSKHSEKEMNETINEFLSNPSKKIIYRLIDNIEIDENKNIYIHFAFSKLNVIKEINKNYL